MSVQAPCASDEQQLYVFSTATSETHFRFYPNSSFLSAPRRTALHIFVCASYHPVRTFLRLVHQATAPQLNSFPSVVLFVILPPQDSAGEAVAVVHYWRDSTQNDLPICDGMPLHMRVLPAVIRACVRIASQSLSQATLEGAPWTSTQPQARRLTAIKAAPISTECALLEDFVGHLFIAKSSGDSPPPSAIKEADSEKKSDIVTQPAAEVGDSAPASATASTSATAGAAAGTAAQEESVAPPA